MPNNIAKYESSSGTIIELDTYDVSIGTATELRGNYWGYDIDYRSISGVTRQANEITVDCYFSDPEQADLLRNVSDFDVYHKQPGKIWAGDWWQHAYITSSSVSKVFHDYHNESLTVVLLDGTWNKWHSELFEQDTGSVSSEYLDLPTDAPFDLAISTTPLSLTNLATIESPVKITIYGYAINPYVIIGDNRYEVDVIIPEGSRLEIDGTTYPKTITMISSTGDRINCFGDGVRGTGTGSGEYVFEPLQPGYQSVIRSSSFLFEVEWLEQIGTPPWLSSSLVGD